MTTEALNRAFEVALENALPMDEPMPVGETEIRQLSDMMGVELPVSYTEFLKTYGTVGVDGIELYGLLPGCLDVKSIPNTFWLTADLREKDGLSGGLIVVEDLGDGAYACLALLEMTDDEAPVILWETATSDQPVGRFERLAPSFGEYVLQRINSLLT